MATIGVRYNDSGVGTDIAKILMQAVVGDPDRDAKMAALEANLMGAKIDRERTLALAQYEKQEAARKQGVYDYAEGAIDPATQLAMDSYNRYNRPAAAAVEAPVPVAPPIDVATEINFPAIGPEPIEDDTDIIPNAAARVAAMPALSQNVGTDTINPLPYVNLPEGPVPIEQDFAPVAPAGMPTTALKQAPSVVGSPNDFTDPQPGFSGGAKDNGDGTVTTPVGTLPKAEIRKMIAVAMHDEDAMGSLRKITGQLGLTYGDTPEELQKAMTMLGQDPRQLPANLGGAADTGKESEKAGMRKEVYDHRKALAAIRPTISSLESSLNDNTRAGDLAFVYGIPKILDPIGVVRGEDADMIINSAPIPDAMKNQIRSAMAGTGALSIDVRRTLLDMAKRKAISFQDEFNLIKKDYADRARRNNWPVEDIIPSDGGEIEAPPEPAETPSPDPETPSTRVVGEVYEFKLKDGSVVKRRYKGGPESSLSSWEPVS
jgi:hypothetical protein